MPISISGYSVFFTGHENCECYLLKYHTTLSGTIASAANCNLLWAVMHLKIRICPPCVSLDVPLFGLNYCLMGFLMVPHVFFGTFLSHSAFTAADSRVMKKVESPVRHISYHQLIALGLSEGFIAKWHRVKVQQCVWSEVAVNTYKMENNKIFIWMLKKLILFI